MSGYTIGLSAEISAMRYLINSGYRIIKHRYKTPYGEIDIIAQFDKTIVFVEVKHRKKISQAGYAISDKQQYRIINAARIFIQENNFIDYDFRFDAILLTGTNIEHIQNAFISDS